MWIFCLLNVHQETQQVTLLLIQQFPRDLLPRSTLLDSSHADAWLPQGDPASVPCIWYTCSPFTALDKTQQDNHNWLYYQFGNVCVFCTIRWHHAAGLLVGVSWPYNTILHRAICQPWASVECYNQWPWQHRVQLCLYSMHMTWSTNFFVLLFVYHVIPMWMECFLHCANHVTYWCRHSEIALRPLSCSGWLLLTPDDCY